MDYEELLAEIEERLGKDFADRLDDAVRIKISKAVEAEILDRHGWDEY